jgi:metal-responsive CopG/Arc/MetJ family transcriptional regulator
MVVELDVGIAQSLSYLSRSKVIAIAVRSFIDSHGLESLASGMAWPGQPEQPNSPTESF